MTLDQVREICMAIPLVLGVHKDCPALDYVIAHKAEFGISWMAEVWAPWGGAGDVLREKCPGAYALVPTNTLMLIDHDPYDVWVCYHDQSGVPIS